MYKPTHSKKIPRRWSNLLRKMQKKSQKLLESGDISPEHTVKVARRQSEMGVNPCSAARGNSAKPKHIINPTLGCAILSTEIVPSDFTCSVSSLGQYSLHYPPADSGLRWFQLAGSNAHSWTERTHSYFAFHLRLREGIRSHLCTTLRITKIPTSFTGCKLPLGLQGTATNPSDRVCTLACPDKFIRRREHHVAYFLVELKL